MNAETKEKLSQITNNLKNWQDNKKDVDFMNNLLSKADSFKIDYNVDEDNSESFHFYPALEIIEDKKQNKSFELIFYIISKNRDTEEFLTKNEDNIDQFIKKIKVINKQLIQDTKITEKEAILRKERWNTELKKWIAENEMFEVFDIPCEDFNLKDEVIMIGHFGMKNVEQEKEENILSVDSFSPDIIVQQLSLDGKSTSFFDMAKLSPPFGRRDIEFALLKKAK